MSASQREVAERVRELRAEAEKSGIVAPDPWAPLDAAWKGLDVQLEKVCAVGEETLEAVRRALAEGRAEAGLVGKALGLAKALLPLALGRGGLA